MTIEPPFLKNIIIGHNNNGNELELGKNKCTSWKPFHMDLFFGRRKIEQHFTEFSQLVKIFMIENYISLHCCNKLKNLKCYNTLTPTWHTILTYKHTNLEE
jgi:hypothetical protein